MPTEPPAPLPAAIAVRADDARTGPILAEFATESCTHRNASRWRIPVHTSAGKLDIALEVRREKPRPTLHVSQAGADYVAWHPDAATPTLPTARFCSGGASGHRVTADEELILRRWIALALPYCHVKLDSGGWRCQETTVSGAGARLQALSRRATRRWRRQPYTLTRKIFLTGQLAAALKPGQGRKLAGFCSLLASAGKDERTVAMRASGWIQATCHDRDRTVALLGLEWSTREVELLGRIFEKTGHRALLSVNLPLSRTDLWVELQPTPEVDQTLRDQVQAVLRERGGPPPGQVCWHPLFAEQPGLLSLATAMGLVRAESGSRCLRAGNAGTEGIASYIRRHVLGETAFVVTNRHRKLLRLPPGSYDYRVFAIPADRQHWDPAESTATAQGRLQWRKRGSRIAVSRL